MKNIQDLTSIETTIFYSIEKAIKSYRQFAQRNIRAHHLDITIDQWLVLKTIKDNPNLSQKDIAEKVFKDYASITRIIEILVQRNFLQREEHSKDRRRYSLLLTQEGDKIYNSLIPIIQHNRIKALESISRDDINLMQNTLQKIIKNCQ